MASRSRGYQPAWWARALPWVFTLLLLAALIYPFTHPFIQPYFQQAQPVLETDDIIEPEPIAEIYHEHYLAMIFPLSQQRAELPEFSEIVPVFEKKVAFFTYLLPKVTFVNAVVEKERAILNQTKSAFNEGRVLTELEVLLLTQIAERYRKDRIPESAQQVDTWLEQIDILPPELVLNQAANETGWGSSRFARQGLNFFGQWCYKAGCGLVPKLRNEGANHEVAKFDSVMQSIQSYYRNVSRNRAYSDLRRMRNQYRQMAQPMEAEVIAMGMMRYSEREADYVQDLISMIRANHKSYQVAKQRVAEEYLALQEHKDGISQGATNSSSNESASSAPDDQDLQIKLAQ